MRILMNEAWRVSVYNRLDVIQLLDQREFWLQENLPFSRIRATQYVANPYANNDDPLWLIARHQERIIGYIGMIPDMLNVQGAQQKVCWLTSVWVSPHWREKGLGTELIASAIVLYPHACSNSGTPTSVGLVLQKNLMRVYEQRERAWYVFNVNPAILRIFKYNNPLLSAVLPPLRVLTSLILRFRFSSWKRTGLQVEQVGELDAESLHFLQTQWHHDFSLKDKSVFAWRSRNLVYSPRLRGVNPLYQTYFANHGWSQQNILYKLFKSDQMVGMINIMVTDGVLNIPYLYLQPGVEEDFMGFLADVILSNHIDAVYTQNPKLNAMFKRWKMPALIKKAYMMPILITAGLKDISPGRIVQDGDGAF